MKTTPFKLRSGNITPFKKMGSSPLKQDDKTIDIPFEISGKKFPSIVSEEYQELKENAIFSGDIDDHGNLRKDHPVAIKNAKESREGMTYEHRYWKKGTGNTVPWQGHGPGRGDLMPGFPKWVKSK